MAVEQGLYEQLLAALERRHRNRQYVLMAVLFLMGLIIFYLGWMNYKAELVSTMSQEQAITPAGIQLASEKAQIPLTKIQVRDAAEEIKSAGGKPPERIVKTTGEQLETTVEQGRKATGADFAILTNPAKPAEKPVVKTDEPVNLNVYNIKAYPKNMAEVSVGVRGADIAYLRRVDIPKVPLLLPKKNVGYWGPFIRAEYAGRKVDGGLRLVITY